MRPQRVEQRFALGHAKTEHVSVRTTTEEERLAATLGIGANYWMMRAYRLANIGDVLVTLAQHTRTVVRSIVHRDFAFNDLFQINRQALIGRNHVGKIGVAARLRRRDFQG